jgi:hypothetical protein
MQVSQVLGDGNRCGGTTASAPPLVRADSCTLIRCRSEAALDREVELVRLVKGRGNITRWSSCTAATDIDRLGIIQDLICEMIRKGVNFATS